jgi:hypothetical protein
VNGTKELAVSDASLSSNRRLAHARAFQHRESICPGCRLRINTTSDPKDRGMPHPGDLTICLGCGTILRFDRKLRLGEVSMADLERLPQATLAELKEQQDRWRVFKGKSRIISLPPRRLGD